MHIVDELIEERADRLRNRPWLWRMMRPSLYKLLGYKKARAMADTVAQKTGREAFQHVADLLTVKPDIRGLEHLPLSGPVIIIANHPTGLADGVFVFEALRTHRPRHIYMANADALRVIPKAEDIIIPVEWVKSKRTHEKTKKTLNALNSALMDEKAVVIFPSGALAFLTKKGLVDRPWNTTAASVAKKKNIPILPLHISSRNSNLYYMLSAIHGELRDITLFHELLNKKNHAPTLTFGALIDPQSLPKGAGPATEYVQKIVMSLKN